MLAKYDDYKFTSNILEIELPRLSFFNLVTLIEIGRILKRTSSCASYENASVSGLARCLAVKASVQGERRGDDGERDGKR